jgi:hypothetical protein
MLCFPPAGLHVGYAGRKKNMTHTTDNEMLWQMNGSRNGKGYLPGVQERGSQDPHGALQTAASLLAEDLTGEEASGPGNSRYPSIRGIIRKGDT